MDSYMWYTNVQIFTDYTFVDRAIFCMTRAKGSCGFGTRMSFSLRCTISPKTFVISLSSWPCRLVASSKNNTWGLQHNIDSSQTTIDARAHPPALNGLNWKWFSPSNQCLQRYSPSWTSLAQSHLPADSFGSIELLCFLLDHGCFSGMFQVMALKISI